MKKFLAAALLLATGVCAYASDGGYKPSKTNVIKRKRVLPSAAPVVQAATAQTVSDGKAVSNSSSSQAESAQQAPAKK